MSAFKHVSEASICLSEGTYIDIQHLLGIFAGSVVLAQRRLVTRQLILAQELLNSTRPGFFRQLLNVFSFSQYRIAEMTVEFFVIAEDSDSEPNTQARFRFAHEHIEYERMRQASIRVSEVDQVAEFRVGEKLISILTIH